MTKLAIGDRVQRHNQPHMRGKVWDIHGDGLVIVKWDDPDENAYVLPRDIEKITPRQDASNRGQ
jgi:hypothetical protein